MEETYRKPSDRERKILERLVYLDFTGTQALRNQLDGILVRSLDDSDNYGSIELRASDSKKAEVSQRIPVEAHAQDKDGVKIEALLHIRDGMLHELEFLKSDGSPILE